MHSFLSLRHANEIIKLDENTFSKQHYEVNERNLFTFLNYYKYDSNKFRIKALKKSFDILTENV